MRGQLAALVLASVLPLAAEDRTELTVLYAGADGSPRMEEWRSFLSKAFTKVETIDLGELDAETGAHGDVVIADWPSTYTQDGKSGRPPDASLGPSFARPIIVMGEAAQEILPSLKIKLDSL